MTVEPFPREGVWLVCKGKFARLCPFYGMNTLLKAQVKRANRNLGNKLGDDAYDAVIKLASSTTISDERLKEVLRAKQLLKPRIPLNQRTSRHRKVRE